jgi:predicted DNA binding protein
MSIVKVKAKDIGWRCKLTRAIPSVIIKVEDINEVIHNNEKYYMIFERICGISFSSLNRWIMSDAYTVQNLIHIRSENLCHDLITIDTQKYIVPILRGIRCMFLPPIKIKMGLAEWIIICLENSDKVVRVFREQYGRKINYIKSSTINLSKRSLDLDLDNNYENRSLTMKQLYLIRRAYIAGYYNYPRKISLSMLAKIVGIKPSSISKMLRIGERKIIEQYLSEINVA